MDLTLTRTRFEADGIFGKLTDLNGDGVAVTLEHAYDSGLGNGSFVPKVPEGTYTCKRGQHQLESMKTPFTTFQVLDVPDHTNILIHMGNFNRDSDGCILVGKTLTINPSDPAQSMITFSDNTFKAFMTLQEGIDTFTLTVKNA
jgi:hypothetical protein